MKLDNVVHDLWKGLIRRQKSNPRRRTRPPCGCERGDQSVGIVVDGRGDPIQSYLIGEVGRAGAGLRSIQSRL
jgi:hypothetical protein